MLAIGGVDMERHRAVVQFVDQRRKACGLCGLSSRLFVAESLRAETADAQAHQRIRQQAAFGPSRQSGRVLMGGVQVFGSRVHVGRSSVVIPSSDGNHGNSIGVVRW